MGRIIFVAFVLPYLALSLAGCGSAGVRDDDGAAVAPSLRPTLQALPQPEFDEEMATYLPYEAEENPYLALKGRIKKEAVATYIEARRLFKAKDYAGAENKLKAVLEIDGKLSGPWMMRGDIALLQGDRDKAIKHYQQAIVVQPDNINAYLKLAKLQRELGRYVHAQNTYADALTVWRDFPEAHLNLAVLYDLYLNQPIAAQQHMEAYMLLVEDEPVKVEKWLAEVKSRTGIVKAYWQKKQEAAAVTAEN